MEYSEHDLTERPAQVWVVHRLQSREHSTGSRHYGQSCGCLSRQFCTWMQGGHAYCTALAGARARPVQCASVHLCSLNAETTHMAMLFVRGSLDNSELVQSPRVAGPNVTASAAPDTPKSGKTNVIPYSQYRKSRLDSIRNDLGLSGVSLSHNNTAA